LTYFIAMGKLIGYDKTGYFIKTPYKEHLRQICKEYHARAAKIENLKYDLEHEVVIKDYEVNLAQYFKTVLLRKFT